MKTKIVIILLLLTSLIAMSNAQQANYAGAAKVVLQVIREVNLGVNGDYSSYVPGYLVKVVYSSDPSIKLGQTYNLDVQEQVVNEFGWGMGTIIDQFVPGTIIGVNDYNLDGNTINVYVTMANDKQTDAWKQKITILGKASTSSGNPTGETNTGSLTSLTPSIFSSMPSIGTGNSLFNIFSASPLRGNSGLQIPSTPFGNNIKSGQSQPFNMFSNTLNAFPSFGSGTPLFNMGGLI